MSRGAAAVGIALTAACGGAIATVDAADAGAGAASGTSSSSSSSGAPASCSPRGARYERGKGGGAPDCCAGLTQVELLAPSSGSMTCVDLPVAVFACIEGTCGDGRCEPGEEGVCGCTADCTTVPPPPPTPPPVDAGSGCTMGGPFERSATVSAAPCCPGLVEQQWEYPNQTSGPGCGAPLRFEWLSCTKGTCGDGVCEDGERHACGCAKDCPGTKP